MGNQSGDIAAKHAAIRLLKQNPNVALKGIVQKLSKGEELSDVDQVAIDIFARFNEKQSALFWTILHSRTTQVQGTRGELFKRSSGSIFL